MIVVSDTSPILSLALIGQRERELAAALFAVEPTQAQRLGQLP